VLLLFSSSVVVVFPSCKTPFRHRPTSVSLINSSCLRIMSYVMWFKISTLSLCFHARLHQIHSISSVSLMMISPHRPSTPICQQQSVRCMTPVICIIAD